MRALPPSAESFSAPSPPACPASPPPPLVEGGAELASGAPTASLADAPSVDAAIELLASQSFVLQLVDELSFSCPDGGEPLSFSCPDGGEPLSFSCPDGGEPLSFSCHDGGEPLSFSCPDGGEPLAVTIESVSAPPALLPRKSERERCLDAARPAAGAPLFVATGPEARLMAHQLAAEAAALREADDDALPEEEESFVDAEKVKYHRDRDFLEKHGWQRMASVRTGRVVYFHREERWPAQPSVKGVRRVMGAYFSRQRQEHRTLATLSDSLLPSLDALETVDHDPRRCLQHGVCVASPRPSAEHGEMEAEAGGGVAASPLAEEWASQEGEGDLSHAELSALVDCALLSDDELAEESASCLVDGTSVKYHRDRDFLGKYGWRRMVSSKTGKAVYIHEQGRWPPQASVKRVRRAMRAFFDKRRCDRAPGVQKRPRLPKQPTAALHGVSTAPSLAPAATSMDVSAASVPMLAVGSLSRTPEIEPTPSATAPDTCRTCEASLKGQHSTGRRDGGGLGVAPLTGFSSGVCSSADMITMQVMSPANYHVSVLHKLALC